MPFNSFRFVLFAAIAITVYNLVPSRHRLAFLVIASFTFYADSSLIHAGLLGLITALTFGAALAIQRRPTRPRLALAIVAVASPLFFFKYYAFLGRLTTRVTGSELTYAAETALPLGVSFYTFQAIAYLVDVYRGTTPAARRPGPMALFLVFFPKLLAGPIERARDLMPQIQVLTPSVPTNLYAGLKLALWGFFCKLVVADNIATIVDNVLRAPQQESGGTLWIVFVLYAFQIYFDFLGYTNIALGVARCFNVHLNPNFNVPYAATSLQEFWRRWHISLSTWFRDYVYRPLGGKRTRGVTRAGQVLAVFLFSGLWHGAALNFAAWGAFHGGAYWIEEQFRKRLPHTIVHDNGMRQLQRIGQRALTFTVVTVGWVFFRLTDASSIAAAFQRMFFVHGDVPYLSLHETLLRSDSLWFVAILGTALCLDSSRLFREALERVPKRPRHVIGELAYVNWFVLTLVLLGDLGVRDFTYFGF